MFRTTMVGAVALLAAVAMIPDRAFARGGHGGGFHGGGGGGFHAGGGGFRGGSFAGGGAVRGGSMNRSAFRGANAFHGSMSGGAFRGANANAARIAAVPGGAARFAANPSVNMARGRHGWHHHHRGWRGFGYGGLALGLAAAPYYYDSYASYPYDDSYYYADNDPYYVAADDSSCYVARRVHTRHGWRIRRVFICN